jgi:hypothetical protein
MVAVEDYTTLVQVLTVELLQPQGLAQSLRLQVAQVAAQLATKAAALAGQ